MSVDTDAVAAPNGAAGAHLDEEPVVNDPISGDDPLEASLRQLLPGNTFWRHMRPVPEVLKQFAEEVGEQLAEQMGGQLAATQIVGDLDRPQKTAAVWTYPDAVWMLDFRRCGDSELTLYHVNISGADTKLSRTDVTADQAVQLLTSIGAIRTS
jgi:hypothetical protein